MKKNKVIALTKIFLKNSFQNHQNRDSNTKKSKTGMKIVFAISFLYMAGLVGFFSFTIIQGLIEIQQEAVFIGLLLVAIAGFLIFQGIISIMNVFYFSKDIETILPLPLKPKQILMAKFNVVLISEYIMELILGLVPFIMYGVLTQAGILYYIIAVIILVVFPILPLLIAATLVMIVMSFGRFTKKKDTFQVFASLLIIVIVFASQFLFNSKEELTQEQMLEMITQSNGLITTIQDYFITVKPAVQAMTEANIVNACIGLIKVIGITAIAYLIFMELGQKLYLKGVVGNLTGGKSKKKNINAEKSYRKQKIGMSYVKKELKILVRNPVFLMQCVLPAILFPILFLGIFCFTGINEEAGMSEFTMMIPSTYHSVMIFVLLGIAEFFSTFIYVAITAISREGLNATFTKYIPLSYKKQFLYKAIPNVIMHGISNAIAFALIFMIVPQTPILFIIAIWCVSLLLAGIHSLLELYIDLKRPKLEWNTEYAVVKQNINLIFPMLFGLIGVIIMVVGGIFLANVNPIITLVIVTIMAGIILYSIQKIISKKQVNLFEKIN